MQQNNFNPTRLANCMDGVAVEPMSGISWPDGRKSFCVHFRLPEDKHDRSMRISADNASEAIQAVKVAYPQAEIQGVS